jgi:hypothetical protein
LAFALWVGAGSQDTLKALGTYDCGQLVEGLFLGGAAGLVGIVMQAIDREHGGLVLAVLGRGVRGEAGCEKAGHVLAGLVQVQVYRFESSFAAHIRSDPMTGVRIGPKIAVTEYGNACG